MDSNIVFLYDPHKVPFGKLSPNYQEQIKYKDEEASSVISYAYGGLVPIVEKAQKDYILKQANMNEISDYTNSLLIKHINNIYLESIKKAYKEKLNNPKFVKYILDFGTNSNLIYNNDDDLLLGTDEYEKKGKNIAGKILSKLRDDKVKTIYDFYLLNYLKKENELKYKINAVYSTLERKFVSNSNFLINNNKMSGIDGLSFYKGKTLDELVNLLGISPLNDKMRETKMTNVLEYAYRMPDKIPSIIRVLNYKKYNEQILKNDKIMVRRKYLFSLSKNTSEITSLIHSLTQEELSELDDRLYFYASNDLLGDIKTSKLNFIKEEDINKEKKELEDEYNKKMKIFMDDTNTMYNIIGKRKDLDQFIYTKFLDYVISKLYDSKYSDLLVRTFNSVIFSDLIDIDSVTDLQKLLNEGHHKNLFIDIDENGEYIVNKKQTYSYFDKPSEIENYIKSQPSLENIMFISYPLIKDFLSIKNREGAKYYFHYDDIISPEYKELFIVDNFNFPSVLHYAYYNMYKEISNEIIDYNHIEKSPLIFSHDNLLLESNGDSTNIDNYKNINLIKREFDASFRVYKSIILKKRARIALEMKFDNFFMKKLLVSTENKKLLYNNPKDDILGCKYKDEKVIGDNFIGEELEKMRKEFKEQIGEVTLEKIDEVYYFYYYVNGNLKLEKTGLIGEKTAKMFFDDNFNYMMGRVKEFVYILHLYNSFFIKSKNIDLPEVKFVINNLYSRCYETLEDLSVKVPRVPNDFFEYIKDYSNLYQKYFISKEAVSQIWKSIAIFDMLYRSDMDKERINNKMLNIIKQDLLEDSKLYNLDVLENRNLSIVLHAFINVYEKLVKHNSNIKFDKNTLSFIYYLISSKDEKDYFGTYKEDEVLKSNFLGKVKTILSKNNIKAKEDRDDIINFMLFLMNKLSKNENDISRALFFADISRFDKIIKRKSEEDQEDVVEPSMPKEKDIFDDIFGEQEDKEKDILNKKIRARYGYEDEEDKEEDEEEDEADEDEDGYDIDDFGDEDDDYNDDM